MKEFRISIVDKPGTLATLAEALGSENINIEGGLGYACSGEGHICVITNNTAKTASIFDDAGIEYSTQDVVMTNLENKPGQLANLTRAFADAGINITSFYITVGENQIFGTDNNEAAKDIASKLGVLVE